MRTLLFRAFIVITSVGFVRASLAQDQAPRRHYVVLHPHAQGTPATGKPRCLPHTDERAGYPRGLSGHLEPSTTSGGIGYYVGGGTALSHGEGHQRDEGTWGWDETGCRFFRHRNILIWSHGRRYQGGTGSYTTDGPHIPDFIYGATSAANNLTGRKRVTP
jgi:hypothetical protein